MRIRILSLALLALVLSLPAYARVEELHLDTTPSGAEVWISGVKVGTTPLVRRFPVAYFQAPLTAFARHLGLPLEVTFRLQGYKTQTVKLGRGPYKWHSLNFVTQFDYYILEPDYNIPLDPEVAASGGGNLAYLDELERLGELRDSGVLTEEEFQVKKSEVLSREPPAILPTKPLPAIRPSTCPLVREIPLTTAVRDLPEISPTALDFAQRKGTPISSFYSKTNLGDGACQRARVEKIQIARNARRGDKTFQLEIAPKIHLGSVRQHVDLLIEVIVNGNVLLVERWRNIGVEHNSGEVPADYNGQHRTDLGLTIQHELAKDDFAEWWSSETQPFIRVTLESRGD